ncbi:MAG: epoxyqueuosine reductase, partial [Syntrophobacteraceae bacterium]
MPCTDQRREPTGDLPGWLESAIKEFCMDSPDNSLKNKENDRAFDKPLVGFSSGCDPLYRTIKEDIGPFYMTPIEVFEKSFPDTKTSADKLTVISWI